MSISRAYNHKLGVCYAYETTYEWSDEEQKNVAVRKCIGHFDPVTDEIVPNGKRGRKSVYPRNEQSETRVQQATEEKKQAIHDNEYQYLADVFRKIQKICADAAAYYEDKAKGHDEKSP